ncbi:hypothetical protein EDB89DRAFT_1913288 [Lactarius sanguifluus]|nr:hypothetical protein EDB89DRAFT_1913288 [Lactarius sanguifluus]
MGAMGGDDMSDGSDVSDEWAGVGTEVGTRMRVTRQQQKRAGRGVDSEGAVSELGGGGEWADRGTRGQGKVICGGDVGNELDGSNNWAGGGTGGGDRDADDQSSGNVV